MSGPEANGDEPKFKWGKKSHTGRVAEKPAYFYESFTYDGIEYFLYDSVYLHAANEPEPYIGKLLKAWEYGDPAMKRIKVLWFFRPIELQNWLGDHQPQKNELFLASGEGVGLANINPLEALVGKCSVICTSKDKRNHPPSELELKEADYIFYRVFDVSSYTISENIADKIGGVKVNLLFNRRGHRGPSAFLKVDANGGVKVQQTVVGNMVEEATLSMSKEGETDNKGPALPKESRDKLSVEPLQSTLEVLRMNHLPTTDNNKQSDADVNSANKSTSMVRHGNFQDEMKAVKRSRVLSSENALETGDSVNEPASADLGSSENRISKKMKLDDVPIQLIESLTELIPDKENTCVVIEKSKHDLNEDEKKTSHHVCEDVQAKIVKGSNSKDKMVSQLVKPSEQLTLCPEELKPKKPVAQSSENNVQPRTGKDSKLEDTIARKLVKSTKVVSSEELKSEVPSAKVFDKASKFDDREVARKVDTDRSKWFKELTWEEQMQKAQEHGKLVLLSNLDPSYNSAEVEEIIWSGFREKCKAKVLQFTSFSSPHCGQAFVIFMTREAAELVIKRLNEGCFMLSSGRPLVAAKRAPLLKENSTKFVGHLSIDKQRVINKEEWKRAVFTSHCSQPNTIEYEMALEWKLLQEQFGRCWKELYEQQGKELKGLKCRLKKE
ncbi:protein ANTI-SILENCING 1-like [Nymphaea colorata]|nr:protein ANTI-SILENCING 1-like [Nymphaea colorata]